MKPMDLPLRRSAGSRPVAVDRLRGGRAIATQDCVAEEVPVALEYNGVSHAVMLATPADLEDFGLGFSLTEDIVDRASDIRGIDVVAGPHGITVRIDVASACFVRLKERRRNLAGRSGCGLCGMESLPEAVRAPPVLRSAAAFPAHTLLDALHALRGGLQPLHEATGATHAAGFGDASGQLLLVREDVGRHNALDKLIGALVREGHDVARGFIVSSSRASYEMASKTARSGATLLAAVSGVTGLAIDLAQAAGLALVGFARGDAMSIYSHAERVLWDRSHG
ncbi:formate dehydrogenase accessory sulfurtransferase FdhD [Verminephrobacter aporrectodeae subsp. tuberculatae]|uniref:formate dehydrogenase accessory sulfurtransferase FdhD n=1 Tax=Verminephrobacter aporrectodeae TaxID=1110389 RepID=UPI002244BE6D|nr:formate dehydrogenase accessory sulfurtransferase FdhD [Verminephrobacter aporrectodeae]MCW8165132.1 formate dehydrogenase accessory sulfurtransferase FdhD [Verminephrobacter aporrectodeae subsp. tuberculatae]MCW8168502.1 formate dehydrogenase accessory sulfurtransferase FdhD [Verminephrobacter aporrectodeae subsp. tuberculatae]